MAQPHHKASAAYSSALSATTSYNQYDVFINCRGPDVKDTFASALYHSLVSRGLQVFLDKPELQPGADITSQIEAAIEVASVHIAIFSPNYAQSRWCLDELVLMVKSRATILPVFHNVKPSELRWAGRNKDGAYAEALRNHEEKQRYDFQTIQNWRAALSHVSCLSGFELEASNGDEMELLDKVVKSVLKMVPVRLDVAKYPTGLAEKMADFEMKVLLEQQEEHLEAKVVGIVGSAGVGKTTLAKEFFNCKRSYYSRSAFLFDVRENAAKMSLNHIQSKLITYLTGKDTKIENADGVEILKNHLSSCHALIILDDVDSVNQLHAFLPIKCVLHPRSLILVTSRDKYVLRSAGIKESSIYQLDGLNGQQSRKLFCLCAFFQPYPPPEFEDLVDRVLTACHGLPLSLKVFGALLCGEYDRSDWEALLDRVKQSLPNEIQENLRISYDSLSYEEQQIFLDIAYFFIDKDMDMAIRIWNGSGWNGLVGFRNLQNKCLVEVDSKNKITMHDHLQNFGRNIVDCSNLMPRRLWRPVENFHVLSDLVEQPSSGSGSVMPTFECVNNCIEFLFKSIFHTQWYHCSSLFKYIQVIPTEVRGFRISSRSTVGETCDEGSLPLNKSSSEEVFRISKLQLLEAEGDFVENILIWGRSPNLLWLRWNECPCSSLPSWIPMRNLRVLEVAGRALERLWQRKSQAPLELRELNIDAPLLEFPKSLVQLKHLEKIVLSYSEIEGTHITTLPEEFCCLQSLKYLELKRCYKLEILPDSFGNLINLQHIDLSVCKSLRMLPDSFGNLSNLEHINMTMCERLEMLPNSFGNLSRLLQIDLSCCKSLKMLPNSLGNLTDLQCINMSMCQKLKILPISLGNLKNLQNINLSSCKSLQMLPDSLGNLANLHSINMASCESLQRVPDSLGNLTNLHSINLSSCKSLKMLPDSLGNLTNVHSIDLSSCESLQRLPDSLGNLSNLHSINLSSCKSLQIIPDSLRNLTNLEISDCSLRRLEISTGLNA